MHKISVQSAFDVGDGGDDSVVVLESINETKWFEKKHSFSIQNAPYLDGTATIPSSLLVYILLSFFSFVVFSCFFPLKCPKIFFFLWNNITEKFLCFEDYVPVCNSQFGDPLKVDVKTLYAAESRYRKVTFNEA